MASLIVETTIKNARQLERFRCSRNRRRERNHSNRRRHHRQDQLWHQLPKWPPSVRKTKILANDTLQNEPSCGSSFRKNYAPDLHGLLLKESERGFTTQELVDECKTFFFGGHETTALAITWTMLLLATHQDWQHQLREESREVVRDNKEIDVDMLSGLKKMGWVMNEALRLYPSSPNAQRQAKADIQVSDDLSISSGTNMWIDIVGMHHDPALWGEDVNEFKPERFKDDIHGGCKDKMGYLPFGFGLWREDVHWSKLDFLGVQDSSNPNSN